MILAAVLLSSCTSKKQETDSAVDSLAVDSLLMMNPGPSLLAYSPVSGFSLDNKLVFTDSVNYFMFSNQEELNKKFIIDKSSKVVTPDFLINYVVAVACAPTTKLTTIVMDRVETSDSSIDVYLTIQRGEDQKFLTTPAQIFVVEKRNGFSAMQFFVNGKMDKAFVLGLN